MRNYASLPALLRADDGAPIADAAQWPARRARLLDALSLGMYGVTPPPCPAAAHLLHESDSAFGGKAVCRRYDVELDAPLGKGSFPVVLYVPKTKPTALLLALAHMVGEGMFASSPGTPVEEIVDEGFAIALIDYTAVSSDDGDFATGIAPLFPRDPATGWGKIGIWAYAVSRFLDCAKGMDDLAALPVAVSGYSRLGKTALWCGAQDARIGFTLAGGSGTGGVAISRGNPRESFDRLLGNFPFWLCGAASSYAGREAELPFDQHFAVAACAPRRVYACADVDDLWADPFAEYDSCRLASAAWQLLGLDGLVAPENDPAAHDTFHDGEIGFHLRPGTHAMTRQDWLKALAYIRRWCEE